MGGILVKGGSTPELTVRDWRKKSIFRQCCHDIPQREQEGQKQEVPGGLVRTTDLPLTFSFISHKTLCWRLCKSLFAAPSNSSYVAFLLLALAIGSRAGGISRTEVGSETLGTPELGVAPGTGWVRKRRGQPEGESFSRGYALPCCLPVF